MAKTKCDLNNLVLLENGHSPCVDNEFDCTNVNTNSLNGCTNLVCSNVGCTSVNNCINVCLTNGLSNNQFKNSQLNQSKQNDDHANLDYFVVVNSLKDLNKNLFKNSLHQEVIKNNKFKDHKANLAFPRKFVNVVKKELTEDGRLKGTKKVTKTCILQPSLFENIPPTIYFGLDNELSKFFFKKFPL